MKHVFDHLIIGAGMTAADDELNEKSKRHLKSLGGGF